MPGQSRRHSHHRNYGSASTELVVVPDVEALGPDLSEHKSVDRRGRIHITFEDEIATYCDSDGEEIIFDRGDAFNVNWRIQPPITEVCRQMRNEALEVYYKANVFVHYGIFAVIDQEPGLCVYPMLEWLAAMGKTRAGFLKSIEVNIAFRRTAAIEAEMPQALVRFLSQLGDLGVDCEAGVARLIDNASMEPLVV